MTEDDSSPTGRTALVVVLTLAFLVGVVALGPGDGAQNSVRRVLGMQPDRPLEALTVPDAGSYAFMQTTDDGDPVGFDPCRPVEIQVNPEGAPPGSDGVVEAAASRLSQATGLLLEMGPTTDDRPTLGAVGELERTQGVTAPETPVITVIWSRARETPSLKGPTVGVGGSTAYAVGDARPYYLRGGVALDVRPLREALLRGDGPRRVTAVVMHELAHALGLDHVTADGELMNADNLGRLELGPGDRAGLARVGAIPCA